MSAAPAAGAGAGGAARLRSPTATVPLSGCLLAALLCPAAAAPASQSAAGDEVRAVLEQLGAEHRELAASLRGGAEESTTPRAAMPAPRLEELASRIGEDGVLLAYAVDESRIRLAMVPGAASAAPAVKQIAVTRQELARRVSEVHRLVHSGERVARGQLVRSGDELGELLLGPAADSLRSAERVVVQASGPLLGLPFALLRLPYELDSRRDLLLASRSLCMETSLAVPGGGGQEGVASDAGPTVVAFADPVYRPTALPLGASMSDGGVSWRDRAARRHELERLKDHYAGATLLVGAQATREALLGLEPGTDLLHLALEARVDPADPAASWLVLAEPEDSAPAQRVLLGELVARVRLEATLVVLSGLNVERSGAGGGPLAFAVGLRGLGARQVLASLWRAPDESPAALFDRFYRRLAEGAAATEALRLAQLELLHGPIEVGAGSGGEGGRVELDLSAPAHWAGYQVLGDCLAH